MKNQSVLCLLTIVSSALARDLSVLCTSLERSPQLEEATLLSYRADLHHRKLNRRVDETGQRAGGPTKRGRSVRKAQSNPTNLRGSETSSPLEKVSSPEQQRPQFDFIVGGFPKCGTTTLLKAFASHEETDMSPTEQCAIASPGQADNVVHQKMDATLASLTSDPSTKRSFKCPTAMYNYKSIVRMEKHSPDAKLVIGVRHPVKMLQSFYNYRVTEINTHDDLAGEPIPTLHEIIESGEPWKGVSLEAPRFELFLMQLGKTSVSSEQMMELYDQKYDLAIKPTTNQVFLYSVDQLEDTNEERSTALRRSMADFLDLKKTLNPFGHENKNYLTGESGFKETINICDDEFKEIRNTVVLQGKATAEWIQDQFLESNDVTVANKDHLIETLEQWGTDPCAGDELYASSLLS